MLAIHFNPPWRTAGSLALRRAHLHAWQLYLVVSGGAVLSYLLLPSGSVSQATVFLVAQAMAVGVISMNALRADHRADRTIWGLLAAGQALGLVGNLVWYWAPVVMHVETQFPSWSDAMFLSSSGIGMVAIILIVLKRGRGDGWAPAVDAMVLTVALAGLSWLYLIEPNLTAVGASASVKAVAIAYPLMDLALFAVVVRLVASARRLPAAWLIAAWGAGQLAGDTIFATATIAGTFRFGDLSFIGWLISYAFIGMAALHPSSRAFGSAAASASRSMGMRRMVLLASLMVAAPGAMLLMGFDDAIDLYVLAGVSGAIFLLVFIRMAGLVSTLARAESLSRHLSLHDQLTGLPNRTLVVDRTSHALSAMTRRAEPVSFLVVDLDEFKEVNDGFGHEAGDHLLQHVAETLKNCIRPGDSVARWGGDEFCVLLRDADTSVAVTVARRIMDDLMVPVFQDGKEITTGASVGIATCHDASISAEELFRNADLACYAAKSAGRQRYRVFDPSMPGVAMQAFELRLDLERAIAADEFEVHFQPIVNLESGDVVEVEALVRWNHPSRGLVPPLEFVGLAEETGLIVRLGEVVMRKACTQVVEWHRSYPTAAGLNLSVNVSPRQLMEPGFGDEVLRILEDTGMNPAQLVCEVTERAIVDESSNAVAVLSSLRAQGIKVAIDDFGTGYSSLRYLTELPADVVKIDGSFVRRVSGEAERAFVLAIMRVIETIGMETVAEGIETREQADYMRAMGCDRGQGYYLGKPLKAADIAELLDHGRTPRPGNAEPTPDPPRRPRTPARALKRGRLTLSMALTQARLKVAS